MIRALRRAARTRLEALRDDRGVADPAIVMITIVVLIALAVAGTYVGRGFVEQARDANAQADLDRIASSQEFYAARASNYTDELCTLVEGSVSFTVSQGVEIRIAAIATNDPTYEPGWIASARHVESGNVYFRSSDSSATYKMLANDTSPAAESPTEDADDNPATAPTAVAPPAGLSWSAVTTDKAAEPAAVTC